jgi:hypothetical protein
MAEILVVTSKVKKMVKEAGFRTGADYIQALSDKVNEMIKASIDSTWIITILLCGIQESSSAVVFSIFRP